MSQTLSRPLLARRERKAAPDAGEYPGWRLPDRLSAVLAVVGTGNWLLKS